MPTTFINLWEISQLASSRTHLNFNLEAPDIENAKKAFEKMAAKLLPISSASKHSKKLAQLHNIFFSIYC